MYAESIGKHDSNPSAIQYIATNNENPIKQMYEQIAFRISFRVAGHSRGLPDAF